MKAILTYGALIEVDTIRPFPWDESDMWFDEWFAENKTDVLLAYTPTVSSYIITYCGLTHIADPHEILQLEDNSVSAEVQKRIQYFIDKYKIPTTGPLGWHLFVHYQ